MDTTLDVEDLVKSSVGGCADIREPVRQLSESMKDTSLPDFVEKVSIHVLDKVFSLILWLGQESL